VCSHPMSPLLPRPFHSPGGTLVCGLAAYGAGVSEWGATFDLNLFSLIADPLWLPQVWEKKHRADGSGGARKLRTQKAGLDQAASCFPCLRRRQQKSRKTPAG